MIKNRIALVAVAGSAALVPLAGISALTSGVASAAKTPKGISCSGLKGKVKIGSTIKEKVSLSGCSGTTGGSGTSKGTVTATGPNVTTVDWTNGKATTASENNAAGSFTCANGGSPETITGTVTADNTKSTAKGAAVNANVCVVLNSTDTKGTITLEPGTDFTFAA